MNKKKTIGASKMMNRSANPIGDVWQGKNGARQVSLPLSPFLNNLGGGYADFSRNRAKQRLLQPKHLKRSTTQSIESCGVGGKPGGLCCFGTARQTLDELKLNEIDPSAILSHVDSGKFGPVSFGVFALLVTAEAGEIVMIRVNS
ncbi:hypothetical protein C5167_004399 [Papaver somniferum]|uniref:Uncharacterized protein n=1 Tax=Papaver somniferum TaxID=3469 RepID=A0A4Y7JBT8_PAPSO|nr:hypothetical protein C5167_004399 [Papaver somniferum]